MNKFLISPPEMSEPKKPVDTLAVELGGELMGKLEVLVVPSAWVKGNMNLPIKRNIEDEADYN